jgi:putative aldouronate transport system permease protein
MPHKSPDIALSAAPVSRYDQLILWRKRLVQNWQLYLLILPPIITVFIFHYVPIYGVQIAFKNFRSSLGIWGSQWVGLKYFIRFINYPYFWSILWNTVSIQLYALATFPCTVAFALMLNELDNKRYKKTVQMITYAPHFISTIVICSMIMLFLNQSNGLVNSIIEALGGRRNDFMTNPAYFRSIYVWSDVWQHLGWGTIIYLATLSNVSPDWIEAARIDGASRFQIVRHINLPYLMPTIVTLLILRTGSMVSVGFEKIFLLQNSLNLSVSQVVSTYVYQIGLLDSQFSYSAAIGLFNNVIEIIIIMTVNRIAKTLTHVGLW